jgi:hypothetical protein
MKKLLFAIPVVLLMAAMIIIGCEKTNDTTLTENIEQPVLQRTCAANDVLNQQLQSDPSLSERMNQIEQFTTEYEKNPTAYRLVNGVIEIPVVVNVLYRTTSENISLTQIQSQITVLNNDFQALNTDYNNTPTVFQSVRSGNMGIRFVLDTVIRKSTTKTSWSTNDAMKKSSQGGLNPLSPTTKLNMWCCNLSGGILGYSQFPGGSSSTDGVVIDNNAFGSTGTVTSPYNKGRTATHEVGHWMNLRHIWGDATCGSDLVNDTPIHTGANYGCPSYPANSTCGGTTHPMMTMNYMDYTDDACMYMFTLGQKSRILACFASGGPRYSFAQ